MAGAATTSLKLDGGMKARVQKIAEAQRRTSHWIMREAIETYVAREEKREQLRQDLRASWEEYQGTGLHLTGEEVDEWLAKVENGENPPMPECHR